MQQIPHQRRRLGVIAAAVTLGALLLSPMWASARPGGRGEHSEQDRQRFHAKMKERMAKMLRQEVGLDEARAKQVEAIFEGRHKAARQLHEQLRTHRQALRALLEADSNDQAAYQKALDGIEAGHKALRAHREEGIAQARRILSPKEQAKLLRAMHQRGKHRMGRGGRGHHGPRGPDGDGPDGAGPDADDGPGPDGDD